MQQDPGLYFFINQGCLSVDNMDDKEEMDIVDVSAILTSKAFNSGAYGIYSVGGHSKPQ